MSIHVVTPIDAATVAGLTDRSVAFSYVINRLAEECPIGWEIGLGVVAGEPWCKAEAVRAGIDALGPSDVLIVHDADVVVNLDSVMRCVEMVSFGDAKWAIPHGDVLRLDEPSTRAFMANEDHEMKLVRPAYHGMEGGGIVVVRGEVYEDCPLDRNFLGWGSEDQAWGWALRTLHGEPYRGEAPLMHLYHEHAAPGARRSPLFASERLHRAYRAYRNDPKAMRALVDAAR